MEVSGDLRDLKRALRDFIYGEFEEIFVVGLELDHASLRKDPVISAQVFGG